MVTQVKNFLPLKSILPPSKLSPTYSVRSSFVKELLEDSSFKPLPFKHTRVGIEVEVENFPMSEIPVVELINSMIWWKVSQDPSLRNYGIEFQSPGPIAGEDNVGRALAELFVKIKAYKKGDFSFRTGIHVHLCLSEFTLTQMLNFYTAYNFIEPYLFEAFCPQRKFSNFCVPIGDNGPESGKIGRLFRDMIEAHSKKNYTFPWPGAITSLWTTIGAPGAGGQPNYKNKYSAINFSRIKEIGTVEFRHLPGTRDFLLLRDWISTITSLADFCFSLDFEKFSKLISKASTLDKVKRIFNKIVPKEVYRPVPDAIFSAGIIQAKKSLLGGSPTSRKNEPVLKKTGKLIKVAEEISKRKADRLKNSF